MFDKVRNKLGPNMVLNVLKGISGVIFPLITFPHVSKVLGVDNLGLYSFASSIVSYFLLAAGLGIGTYAVREGARFRKDKVLLNVFASEMFTISVVSSCLAYIVFVAIVILFPSISISNYILIILSFQILSKSISVEWIYSIYEDYLFITLRYIISQIIIMILLFTLIRNRGDVTEYAAIMSGGAVLTDMMNYLYSRKYIKIGCRSLRRINWREHIKPIMVLFAMTATVVIYVNSDVTMLGIMCDNYVVGIYSVSTKIYSIVKTVLGSILIVSIPHLSALLGSNDTEAFEQSANRIYRTLLTFTAPAIVGIILLRKELILLLSAEEYISASTSLLLLGIALFFCMGAWFWGQCILVPYRMEKEVFRITVVSALVNVVLNFLVLPVWEEKGAAVTTVIAEGISFAYCYYVGYKIVKPQKTLKSLVKVVVGCMVIIVNIMILSGLHLSNGCFLFAAIVSSVVLYVISEIIMKNETLTDALKKK